jgi:CheY-like chemotaxis protein/anti-sigma regulatory factor (Ser/Thr protein kinase)
MLIEPEPVDLEAFLDEVVRSMALSAHQKSLEIAAVHGERLPARVLLDPHRMRQVLVNLLGNAVKFTERGAVTLRTQLAPPSDGRASIEIVVEDTGIGIAPERLTAIFDPFTQADGSTSRRFGGTGLGLTISARLVELMGGRISVDSQEGRGSTFRIVLPLNVATATPDDAGDLEGLHVLVVDDSPSTRAALEALVRRLGATVAVAASAAEAIQRLESTSADGAFDVVLIDFQMPLRSGLDALHAAHRHGLPVPPAVLLLASAELALVTAHPHAALAAAHLHKPVRRQELVQVVRSVTAATVWQADVRHDAQLAGEPAPATQAGRLRVLLVEDNPVNQMVAQSLLERRGFEVVVTGNGREGVEACQRGTFDLVLMDIQMPEMDGFEALAAIRAFDERSGRYTPVVALTAHAMKEDRDRCLAAGMDDYLSKPIEAARLYDIIRSVLDGPLAPA